MLPPDMEWTNWGGWRWVSTVFVAVIFFCMGWSARGTHARVKRFRVEIAEWKEKQAKAAAEMEGPTDGA